MKHSLKRMMLLLAVLLTLIMPLHGVHAESMVKDGVSVTLSTDKDSYAPGETVKVNLLLKNDSGADLQNVTMENLTPAGCVMVPGTSAVKELPTLANNGQVTLASSFQVEKDIVPPKTGDDTPIFLWISLALLSGCLLFALKRAGAKRTITMLLIFVLTTSLLPVEFAQADTAQINPQQLTVKKNVAIKGVPSEVRSQVTFGAQAWAPDDEDALFYKEPDPEHIQYDETRDIYYVDNQILLIAKEGTPQAQVKALVESYGGTIVGLIAMTDDYQAEFKQAMTYAELEDLCNKLRANSYIDTAHHHFVFEISFTGNGYIPNDEEWKKDWGTDSGTYGKTWGFEAIQAPEAWKYRDLMSSVNVGIFDNMFDIGHEDLSFSNVWNNPRNMTQLKDKTGIYAHGTLISGIIGAMFDNKIGIAGVAPKVNLYGFSSDGTTWEKQNSHQTSEMKMKSGLAQLVSANCRVINMSLTVANLGKDAYSLINSDLDDEISKLVKNGFDFLIVKAADTTETSKQDHDFLSGHAFNDKRILVVGSMNNENAIRVHNAINDSPSDLLAPGANIFSTWPKSGYGFGNGTSMAAAFASGVAAMCYSINPDLTGPEVKKILCNTTYETMSKSNVLNAKLAVEKVISDAGIPVIEDEEWEETPLDHFQFTLVKDHLYRGEYNVDGIADDTYVISYSNKGFESGDKIVTIPKFHPDGRAITVIDEYAFNNCDSIEHINIPDSVKIIGGAAFVNCSNLKSIRIPGSVVIIDGGAFTDCKKLATVQLSEGLEFIGPWAFQYCTNLKSINLPNSLIGMDWSVFLGCESLKSITIPAGMKLQEGAKDNIALALKGCNGLESIQVSPQNTDYVSIDGVLFNQSKDTLIAFPGGRKGTYRIPDGVTKIVDSVIAGHTKLDTVIVPGTVKEVYGLYSCDSLKAAIVEEGAESISGYGFSNCHNLESIYIPMSVRSIGGFPGCDTNKLTIYGYTGSYAQQYANENNIHFFALDGNKLNADKNIVHVKSVTLGGIDLLSRINTGYEEIGIDDTLELFAIASPENATCTTCVWRSDNPGVAEVDQNGVVTGISEGIALITCYSYTDPHARAEREIHVGEGYGEVEIEEAFDFYRSLLLVKSFVFGKSASFIQTKCGVTLSEERDFPWWGEDLTIRECIVEGKTIELLFSKDRLKYVYYVCGEYYDRGSLDLARKQFGQPLITEVEYSYWSLWGNKCSFEIVMDVYAETGEPFCKQIYTYNKISDSPISTDEFEFTALSTTTCEIKKYNGKDAAVVVPQKDDSGKTVVGIGANAFKDCSSLQSVTVPINVTTIGEYAFASCNNLSSIILPSSLTSIGAWAFAACGGLTDITIPDSVYSIGEYAFDYSGLKSIHIPNKITHISEGAFFYCCSLTDVNLPETLTSIGNGAFAHCDNLASIEIPNSVTSIGDGAFNDCISLTSITIPEGVATIGTATFANNRSLTSIFIPSSVNSIANNAFAGSDKVTIYGLAGSYAEQYANENNIPFVANSMPGGDTPEAKVTLTVKNQVGGTIINNGEIIKWPVNQSLLAELSATNGNGKFLVNAYTMSQKPTGGDTDRDYKVMIEGTDDEGFWYNNAEYTADYLKQFGNNTAPTVPFQANAGTVGQYVKIWIAAEDENYTQNQGLAQVWFALELVEIPSTGIIKDVKFNNETIRKNRYASAGNKRFTIETYGELNDIIVLVDDVKINTNKKLNKIGENLYEVTDIPMTEGFRGVTVKDNSKDPGITTTFAVFVGMSETKMRVVSDNTKLLNWPDDSYITEKTYKKNEEVPVRGIIFGQYYYIRYANNEEGFLNKNSLREKSYITAKVTAMEGLTRTITVDSSSNWAASNNNNNWINFSDSKIASLTSGKAGLSTVTINLDENRTKTQRTGKIIFTNEDGCKVSVDILQYSVYGSVEEAEYREWAKNLLTYYLENYLKLEPGTTDYRMGYVNRLERGKSAKEWNYVSKYDKYAKNDAYYDLGYAVSKFMEDIHINPSDYIYPSDEKKAEMFLQMMTDALSQKAESDKSFLTDKAINGTYRFSIDTGKMTGSNVLSGIQNVARNNATEAWGEAMVEGGATLLKGYTTFIQLETDTINRIEKAVKDKAQGYESMDMDTFIRDITNSLTKEMIEAGKNTLNGMLKKATESANNLEYNMIHQALTVDLANKYMNASDNVIHHLKATYIDNYDEIYGAADSNVAFSQYASQLIRALENEMKRNGKNSYYLEKAIENTSGLTKKHVLTTDEWWCYVANEFSCQIIEAIGRVLEIAINDGIVLAVSQLDPILDKAIKSPTTEKKITDAISECFKGIMDDAIDRDLYAIEKAKKRIYDFDDKNSVNAGDSVLSIVIDERNKAFSADYEKGEFGYACVYKIVKMLISIMTAAWTDKDTSSEDKLAAITNNLNKIINNPEKCKPVYVLFVAFINATMDEFEKEIKKEKFEGYQDCANLAKQIKEISLSIVTGGLTGDKNEKLINLFSQLITLLRMNNDGNFDVEKAKSCLYRAIQNLFTTDAISNVINISTSVLQNSMKEFLPWILGIKKDNSAGNAGIAASAMETISSGINWMCLSDKNQIEAMSLYDKAKDYYEKAKEELDKFYPAMALMEVINDVWNTGLKIRSAIDATKDYATGEDALMFIAQMTRQIYLSSHSLEITLHIVPRFDDKTGDYGNRLYHTPESFLDTTKTPDLTPIRVITDSVMTQLNLDITGMANYLTIVKNREEWGNTKFLKSDHMKGVLMTEYLAASDYDFMVRKYNEFLSSYKSSWDHLFQ